MGHGEHCLFVGGLNVPGGHTTEERTQRKFFLSSNTSCFIQIHSNKSQKNQSLVIYGLDLPLIAHSPGSACIETAAKTQEQRFA